jgi:hypothetical protein
VRARRALTKVEKRFYEREDAPRIVTRQQLHYDAFGNVDRFDD